MARILIWDRRKPLAAWSRGWHAPSVDVVSGATSRADGPRRRADAAPEARCAGRGARQLRAAGAAGDPGEAGPERRPEGKARQTATRVPRKEQRSAQSDAGGGR